jgi:hypothetical protein
MNDIYKKTAELADKIRPVLISFGNPQDVLTAVLFIAIVECQESGTTLNSLLEAISGLWNSMEEDKLSKY